jgi:hypothetical protein
MTSVEALALLDAQAKRMAQSKTLIGIEAFERLKARGRATCGAFASATDLCVLSLLVDGSDSEWDERFMIVGTEEFLATRFDLKNLPPGALFLKGEAARKFLAEAEREESRFRREQTRKEKFGGNN